MGANSKKIVGFSVLGVVLILVIWVAVAAASIGGEASTLDSMLKAAMQKHEPVNSVLGKVKAIGFVMQQDPQTLGINGRGPDHWAVAYRTWLTLTVDAGPDAATHGYHIDRASSIF